MAWRDQLQPASFRGVPFEVQTSALTVGRRLARHEYPQRDVPFMEDMGRRAREYKVEGYIIGPEYMAGRDRMLQAVEESGSGQLVHPYHGTKLVTVLECELSESTEFGGMARFTFTFIEAGEQIQPTVGIDSQVLLAQSQEMAFDAITGDFSSAFSIGGLPSWGVADIEKTITGFLKLDDFRSILGNVSAFTSKITGLLGLPASLAGQLLGLIRLLPDASGILGAPNVAMPPSSSGVSGLTVRSAVQRQQSAVAVLVKRAALVHQAGILSSADLATSDDVQAARADVLSRFDAHDYAVGNPRPSAVVATQLKAVRTAALVHLSRQNAALPSTYALQLIEPQSALVLSHAVYGDLRDADIVRRNAIRHPGFLPAGIPIQLTAE